MPAGRSTAGIGVGPRSVPSIVIVHEPGDAARLRRPAPLGTGFAVTAFGSESTLTVGGSALDGEAVGSFDVFSAPVAEERLPSFVSGARAAVVSLAVTGRGRAATSAPIPIPPMTRAAPAPTSHAGLRFFGAAIETDA